MQPHVFDVWSLHPLLNLPLGCSTCRSIATRAVRHLPYRPHPMGCPDIPPTKRHPLPTDEDAAIFSQRAANAYRDIKRSLQSTRVTNRIQTWFERRSTKRSCSLPIHTLS